MFLHSSLLMLALFNVALKPLNGNKWNINNGSRIKVILDMSANSDSWGLYPWNPAFSDINCWWIHQGGTFDVFLDHWLTCLILECRMRTFLWESRTRRFSDAWLRLFSRLIQEQFQHMLSGQRQTTRPAPTRSFLPHGPVACGSDSALPSHGWRRVSVASAKWLCAGCAPKEVCSRVDHTHLHLFSS